MPSPAKGVITEQLAENGGRVEAGQAIFKMSTSGIEFPYRKIKAPKNPALYAILPQADIPSFSQ